MGRAWLVALALAGCAAPRPAPPPPPAPVVTLAPAPEPPDAGPPPLDVPPPPSARRLDVRAGEPAVPVRLMENRREVTFVPRGRVRLVLQGEPEKVVEAPGGTPLVVRWLDGTPADRRFRVQVTEVAWADKDGIAAERATWEARGFQVRLEQLGQVYGIAGKILDNRKVLVLLEPALTAAEAAAQQAELVRSWGARTTLAEEVRTAASIRLRLDMADGTPLGTSEGPIRAETPGGEGFEVRSVEFAVGYPNHGFETREYRGALSFAADASGTIAVVNVVSLEDLLRGLVPSEIFAARPPGGAEGAGRHRAGRGAGEGGHRHLADPYLLCSEQHCAVYRGRTGETACTNAAVEATRGEALFSTDGRLVDSVYSAVCGGHTEDNDVVWGGCPTPACAAGPTCSSRGGRCPTPENLGGFLASDLPARAGWPASPSRRSSGGRSASPPRRWTPSPRAGRRRGAGHASAERGVSGRVRLLHRVREQGATQIRGELTIRRLFGMLNSALFTVEPRSGTPRADHRWRRFRGRRLGARRGHVSDRAPSAGRRPARATGRSSGTTSMAPRWRPSTSGTDWGRCSRTAAPGSEQVVAFRGYVRAAAIGAQGPPASGRSGPRASRC